MGIIKLHSAAIQLFKDNLDDIFQTGNLAEGKWNRSIADYIIDHCAVKHALPTSSNGSGIVSLLTIYRHFFKRTNVLIQSNTMYGVKTMIHTAGCNLVGFIDCQLKTLMPSFQQVADAIQKVDCSQETLVVLLSHIGGIINPDIKTIADYCRKNGIVLLEDCAHSYGATLDGQHSGTFGDAGVFSFYATKAIPAGEGGVAITQHDEIGEILKKFAIYDRFDQKIDIGNNVRPSEIQALLIYAVLQYAEEVIADKQRIADKYTKTCEELSISFIPQISDHSFGNYYKFIIFDENAPIHTRLPTLKTTTSGVYDYALGDSKKIAIHHACLPIWYKQDDNMTSKVIEELYASR